MNRYIDADVICKFMKGNTEPEPIKIRFSLPDESRFTVEVENILDVSHDGTLTNHIVTYLCRSTIEGRQRTYELRYWAKQLKWDVKFAYH